MGMILIFFSLLNHPGFKKVVDCMHFKFKNIIISTDIISVSEIISGVIQKILKWDFNTSDYIGENSVQKLSKNVMMLMGIVCFMTEACGFMMVLILDWTKSSLKHIHKIPRFIQKKLVSSKKMYKHDRKMSVAAPPGDDLEFDNEDSEDDMLDENGPEVKNIEQMTEDTENLEDHRGLLLYLLNSCSN